MAMPNNIECPVDFVLINEQRARMTAGGIFILAMAFLLTGFVAIPFFLVIDFLLRVFKLGRYSVLNLLSDQLLLLFRIAPKMTGQAPKRFAATVGLLFSTAITVCVMLHCITAAIILAVVLCAFALLESAFGFCAGCYVYHFYTKLLKRQH